VARRPNPDADARAVRRELRASSTARPVPPEGPQWRRALPPAHRHAARWRHDPCRRALRRSLRPVARTGPTHPARRCGTERPQHRRLRPAHSDGRPLSPEMRCHGATEASAASGPADRLGTRRPEDPNASFAPAPRALRRREGCAWRTSCPPGARWSNSAPDGQQFRRSNQANAAAIRWSCGRADSPSAACNGPDRRFGRGRAG